MTLDIVGICRFSLLGRGDWKETGGKSGAELETILAARAEMLFAQSRMEERFSTFQHLTLRSLAAQSDKNFVFLVCASDRMPETYQQRLLDITRTVPQVRVRFFSETDVISAQTEFFKAEGLDLANCVQFRLDDDDCLFRDYVERLRHYAEQTRDNTAFGFSFSDLIYSALNHPQGGVFHWHCPFLAAGAAIRHPRRSIYGFGHFAIPRRLPSVVVPGFYSLVTHRGNNDTKPVFLLPHAKAAMTRIQDAELTRIVARDLSYLDAKGLEVAGLVGRLLHES